MVDDLTATSYRHPHYMSVREEAFVTDKKVLDTDIHNLCLNSLQP